MQTVQGIATAAAPLLASANAVRRLVTKGKLAEIVGVTPGRISQYLREGKIYGDAIVGEGRNASIDVDLACSQLGVTLDAAQLAAQGRPVPTGYRSPGSGEGSDTPIPLNDAQHRYQQARADQAEIALRRAKREEEEERGVYIRTEDAKREWTRTLTEILVSLEETMPKMADALAAALHIDPKAATVILRGELRAWRESVASNARAAAANQPEVLEEDDPAGD
ncbi:hypothetical protein ACFPL7_22155 [Dongia soli]|uniref:Uncharacterized protein n=1 Tax=Dongia soli TaxID=600628 RepID=A0ABU5E941_9PROT|nr:hypothetical protein [Dongia soli]